MQMFRLAPLLLFLIITTQSMAQNPTYKDIAINSNKCNYTAQIDKFFCDTNGVFKLSYFTFTGLKQKTADKFSQTLNMNNGDVVSFNTDSIQTKYDAVCTVDKYKLDQVRFKHVHGHSNEDAVCIEYYFVKRKD